MHRVCLIALVILSVSGEDNNVQLSEEDAFCAFGCKNSMVGDGNCDKACQLSLKCKRDDGDCPLECAPGCPNNRVGSSNYNGLMEAYQCNVECFNEACGWDGGD